MTTQNRWKTAPLLLQELFDHDPRQHTQAQPVERCLHAYKTNPLLSHIPVLDERPWPGTQWSITCTCSLCRSHLDLGVAFTDGQQPCPNADYPLHHFEHLLDSPATQPRGVLPGGEAHVCTALGCRAAVVARARPPILSPADVVFLTSKDAHARRRQLLAMQRNMQDFQSPGTTLHTFIRYIDDAIGASPGQVQRIPEFNKRFMLTLGSEGSDLLTRLGFTYAPPPTTGQGGFWHLPDVNLGPGNDPFQSVAAKLQDARNELIILMAEQPVTEQDPDLKERQNPVDSGLDIQRMLGMLDCMHYAVKILYGSVN